jgi:O-antigen ligase
MFLGKYMNVLVMIKMGQVVNITNKKRILINSISLALIISMNYILAIIRINGGISIIIAALLLLQFIDNKNIVNSKLLIVSAIIILFFLFSMMFNTNINFTLDYLLKFLLFGMFSMYLSSKDFNINIVYGVILYIGLLSIPFLHFMDYESFVPSNKMGLSYALLPILLCSIINIFDGIKSKKISVIVLCSSLLVLVRIGSRGAVLSLIVFLLLYFYARKYRNNKKSIFIIMVFGLLAFFISNNFISILMWAKKALNKININIYFINKTISYFQQGKLLNSRDIIWSNSILGIKEAPIIGHGIGTFEAMYDTYTHNLFLNTMWEGGVLFTIPVIIVLVVVITKVLKNVEVNKTIFLILLFTLSYIPLLFSSTLWYNQYLWILISILVRKRPITVEDIDMKQWGKKHIKLSTSNFCSIKDD